MEQQTSFEKAHALVEHIFRALLPEHGLMIREAQIMLCHEMLDTLFEGKIALCDAGVGIGKTHAYLTACLLWQRFRPVHLPGTVVISTSSIALQRAIVSEYIPFLSRVFLQAGILERPICAVVRKGKERFVCEARLAERMAQVRTKTNISRRQAASFQILEKTYDLDEAPGLSGFDRRHVCVPPMCPRNCTMRDFCRYQQYLRESRGAEVVIQICNHNYLLADAVHRQQELRPLLKEHHILVVDEAHKLPEAARQMYSRSVSWEDMRGVCEALRRERFVSISERLAEKQAVLMASLSRPEHQQEETSVAFELTSERTRAMDAAIACLRQTAVQLAPYLPGWLLHRLEGMGDTLELFRNQDPWYVLYIQYSHSGTPALCAASRETPVQLARALWASGRPALLTSGTLATGGNFARAEQMMGLEQCSRIKNFVALSPFDYERNCLLYIPKDMQDSRSGTEAEHLARRIEELLIATHGHALVLFTSYSLMGEVHTHLQNRLPFPLLEAWRNGHQAVRLFKNLSNAVLFAAGPCWEGMDFPGDMVSLLVIARLPFPVPDPVSEAERKQYPSVQEYIRAVVLPDMQSKLRQGFGRAIRTETDTCVVAVLDRRAGKGQRYHAAVLEALPKCRLSDSLEDVARFIRERKTLEYFQQ